MVKLITPLDQIDSYANYTPGSRTVTKDGNEYIYLPGVGFLTQYDFISYQTSDGLSYGSVKRLAINTGGTATVGDVAIAQAAIVAPKYGWFLIKGVGWGNAGEVVASGSPLYVSVGTVAKVGTTVTSPHIIYGSVALGAGISAGTCKVLLNYPYYLGSAA